MYIPTTVELISNGPTLILQKCFLGFSLSHNMTFTDYQFMQSLGVTTLTLEQLEWPAHKIPNYTMLNYDSVREK